MRKALAIVFVTLATALPALVLPLVVQPATAEAATPTRAERRVVAAINSERSERGLAALHFKTSLVRAARAHSSEMAKRDVLTHSCLKGWSVAQRLRYYGYKSSGYSSWTVGETLAAAPAGTGFATPKVIVSLWMDSPGHREVLLTARFRDAGVGIRTAADGTRYFTVDFGRRVN